MGNNASKHEDDCPDEIKGLKNGLFEWASASGHTRQSLYQRLVQVDESWRELSLLHKHDGTDYNKSYVGEVSRLVSSSDKIVFFYSRLLAWKRDEPLHVEKVINEVLDSLSLSEDYEVLGYNDVHGKNKPIN